MTIEHTREQAATDSGRSVVRVRGLRKAYGPVVALHHLDLDIRPGSVVGLIGPNGAGKTTAARCIAGLTAPDAGDVTIAPREAPWSSPLAIANQEIELYPGLTAATNLNFFGRLYGVGDARRVMSDLAEELELGPLLDKRPTTMSIGQRRLVHVAAALMAQPQLLILDEPTAGLDVGVRSTLLAAITRRRSAGMAVMLSSHQMRDIEAVCDSVVMIMKGEVISTGRVDDLIAEHGGARIEVTVDGAVHVVDGTDVPAAIAQVTADGGQVESVNVIKPSLEAVFFTLTGMHGSDEATP